MKNKVGLATALLLLAAINLPHSNLFAQGSLTPPGAPAPTMKSLAQIEPRTPVDATHTPGDANSSFIISQPGSYYLTTNIFGEAGKDGIKIATNNVTLDLNGFYVFGSPTAGNGNGAIYLPFTTILSTITIRNGTVSGWTASGLAAISCFARNAVFEHLTICSNSAGLYCSGGAMVRDCLFAGNIDHGLDINGSGSVIVDNDFVGNNTGNSSGTGSLEIFGSNNRIEDNHITGSGAAGNGIFLFNHPLVTNNIVIRNSVQGNVTNNYSLGTGNIAGPIITNTVSGIITNSNPWANFSF